MSTRIAALACLALTALAQSPPPPGVMTEVSNAQMRTILQAMGLELTEKQGSQSYMFVFQLGGYKTTLLNQGKDMQLYSGFSDKISLSKVNQWNQSYRYCRAYVNDQGGGSIEDDLSFAGGVTKETIEEFLKQYRGTLTTFVKFLNDNSKDGPAATSSATSTPSSDAKPAGGRQPIKVPNGAFTIWIDTSKWKPGKADGPGDLLFENVNGEGYVKIISEKIALPLDTLRSAALVNMRKNDPNAKVVMEEKRTVNGKDVIVLQVDLSTSGIAFRFYGYCYSGTSGSLQIWTFTAASAFERNLADFTELLNGFTASDQPLPASAPADAAVDALSLHGGKMSLQFNPKKWTQKPSQEPGRYRFTHASGDGYGLVIAERIAVSMDAFPDIALNNAKNADPNAKIVVREKRKVNGAEVWFLQMDVVVDKTPFAYYGYYYASDAGSVQIITYTGKNLIAEYKDDFLEFLNGFRVAP